ncbi:MAG: hypothetical protein FJ044_02820 [Candidatus Cloacimonetes bacterium]|nr:hypothetical protein [Candidatus Cloacimonadota bacterium]
MDLQEKLDALRKARLGYDELQGCVLGDPKLLNAFSQWDDAAKDLYEAIRQVVESGKTIVLKSKKFVNDQFTIRTVGVRFNIDWVHGAPERNAKYTFDGARMSAAETIEVLDE